MLCFTGSAYKGGYGKRVVVVVVVMTSRRLGFVSRSRDEPDDVMNKNDNRKCEEEHYCKERREGEGWNAKTQNKNNP